MKKWKEKVSLKLWQVIVILISFLLILMGMLAVIVWQNHEIRKVLPTYTVKSLDLGEDGYGMVYTPIRGPDHRWTGLSKNYTESIMDVLRTREFHECGGWDFFVDKEYKTKYDPFHAGFRYIANDGTKYSMLMSGDYFIFTCNDQPQGYYTMDGYAEFKQWIKELSVWITKPEGEAPVPPAILSINK